MEWISIKDRLPEMDLHVLVSDGETVKTLSLVFAYESPFELVWYDDQYGEGPLSDYPYWMPLPEPPQVNNGS